MNARLCSILVLLPACSMASRSPGEEKEADMVLQAPAPTAMEAAGGPAGMAMRDEMAEESKAMPARAKKMDGLKAVSNVAPAAPPAEEPASPTRAWFPETFLFAPLVTTDARGEASVDVTVPDQLTTWRVLGLAWSRSGSQAGTEARFASTLPRYVDLVMPPALRVGDTLKLPLQAVNNDDAAWTGSLVAEVRGDAAGGQASGSVTLTPFGSVVRYLPVQARRPGSAMVSVKLLGVDKVEKPLTVVPRGRRWDGSRGGTLAGPRTFALEAPDEADDASSSLRLVVYPGPLAVISEELDLAPTRADGVMDAAYALALTGAGKDTASRLGATLDVAAYRKARLLAWQRLVRLTRSPSVSDALAALQGARLVPTDAGAQKLADRLASQVAQAQSPDGSFAGSMPGGGFSLEQALVWSAEAARVAGDRQKLVRRKAAGFIGRNVTTVQDPYTAAILLASDLVTGEEATRLQKLVVDAIQTREDGSKVLVPGNRCYRVDGASPSTNEATARAILALKGDPSHKDLVSDLGAGLVGGYTPRAGFGDGIAGITALEALAILFAEPLPRSVRILLQVDGEELLSRTMDLSEGYTPLVASAPAPGSGTHDYRISSDPAVPGLLYSVTQTSWLPWDDRAEEGFDLEIKAPKTGRVGRRETVTLKAAVPGDSPFQVHLELPVGLDPDPPSLTRLQQEGTVSGWTAAEGLLTLTMPGQPPGSTFTASFSVIPSLAGSFQWGGATLSLVGRAGDKVEMSPGRMDVAVQ